MKTNAIYFLETRDAIMRTAREAKRRNRIDRKIRCVRQARILNWCALDEVKATARDYADLRQQGLIPEGNEE